MKKLFIFTLLLALCLPWTANAQNTITLTGNVTQTIAPNTTYDFYDSGGPDSNYSNYENYTATLTCVGDITINFSQFETENSSSCSDWDHMHIYDGTASNGTLLARGQSGCTSATLTTGTDYVATSGIMTIVWKSDSGTNKPGWAATITGGAAPACPKPMNFTCTATTGTPTATATFTWTNGGTETDWVLEYGTASDFTGASSQPISQSDLVNGEYTLTTGLTAETKYYAHIKADCGGGEVSDWSNSIEFKPSNVQTVAIGSGESTNNYLPAYTYNNNTLSEQIYTTAEIGMAGTISSIAFYNAGSTKSPNFKVYLVHTDKAAFSSATDWLTVTTGDLVFEGDVTLTAGQWTTIEFDTEFEFDGCSNLGLVVDENMSYSSGLACRVFSSTDNCSMYVTSDGTNYDAVGASYSGTRLSVKNQLQLGIIPNLKPSPNHLALVDGSLTQTGATLEWQAPCTASPTGYEYQYKLATDQWPATWTSNSTNLSMPLNGLTSSTTYDFRVRANYAAGDSDPVEIQFTTEASCLPVTNITVSDITSTDAKLAWDDPNGATSWQYLTVAHGDTPDWTSERVITSNTHANVPANIYACTGVQPQPNTEYDFYVRANCGGDDYSEAAMLTFRTACGAITSFPINYGFETSEGFPSNASTPTTNQLGTCWRNEATVQTGSNSTRVWGTSTSNKHTGSQALVLPDKGNSTNFAKTMLVFPEMEFTNPDGYSVSFWIYRNGSGSNPEGFKLYVSDCDTIGPNAVELGHYSRNYSIAYPDIVTSGWYKYETDPITRTGSVYLIFEGQSYYGSATYVDEVTIKEYVTITANQIVNNVSDPATEMTWNEFVSHWNNGDHFTSSTITLMDNISVSTMVGTSDNPFTGTFNGNSHTITVDLTATDDDFTAPFRVIKNATIQNLKVDGTLNDGGHQFCAGFAGDCYGNNIFTNCVSDVTINATIEGDGTHGGFIARNNGGSATGDNLATTVFNGCAFTGKLLGTATAYSAGFCGWSEYQSNAYSRTIFNNCLFAPREVTMSTTYSATFAIYHDASYVNFNNCYFMQDFNDGVNNTAQGKQAYTIAGVDPVYVLMSGEHTLYNMSGIDAYTVGMIHGYIKLAGEGDNVTLALSGAPGYEANHGTLVANGETYTLTMEAFDTEITAVDCPVPFNVEANDVTATSAKIAWEGNSDTYKLMYRNVITAAVDFDETYDFEDGTLQGWTTISNDNDNHAWTIQNGTSYAHGGTKCVYAQYTSSSVGGDANDWLFSPQIPLGGTLSFYAKKSTYGTDRFQVYVSTTGNNISDFTAISEVITPNSTYDLYEYDLSSYSGYGYVAIVYTAPNDQYYIYVDDIHITATVEGEYGAWQTVNPAVSAQPISSLTPETTYQVKVSGTCAGVPTDYSDVVEFTTPATCPAPTELAVTDGSVTAHAATITWTENGEATTWIVEYAGNADFTGALTETVEDNATYSFDDLDGETTYYVRVKAHCGDEDESDYSNVVNFTTLVACQAPTVLTVTEGSVTTNQVELSWTENGTATAWQICLNGDETNLIAANSNPFTLESLTAATSYTVKVRANCGGIDGESAWSNEVSFATECDVITIAQDAAYTYDFENPTPWTCWTNVAGSNDRTSGSNNTTGGSYKLQFKGTTTGNIVAMPAFTPDINGLMLTFWTRPEGYSYSSCGTFSVGYMTDLDDASTFVAVATYDRSDWTSNTYMEKKVAFTSAPAGAYIAFCHNALATNYYWYVDDVTVEIAPTYTLTIEAVGEQNWANGKGGYYLIASPVAENIMPSEDNGFIVGDYDLYYFSQTGDGEGNEWINFKDETLGGFDIVNGKGYLYASKEGTTLTFTGAPSTDGTVALDNYDASAYWKGWNLIGNPLADEAYINRPFYTMNSTSGVLEEHLEGTPIEAMEGVFVNAGEETTIIFGTEAPAKSGSLALNLTQGRAFVDRAIVRFDEGRELPKFQLNENNTKVFFKQDNKDYAVVKAEGMGEMPVSFKAEKNGSFTMNVTSDEVSFSYLHLIDNMTGADVDLLANPTYSFNATTTDYESRFRLVFATGSSVADDTFGFINGAGNLSIFGIEGEATLQVMDVNGRVLSTETFSGSYDKNLNVAAGVYMLRLINGDNVKVQKVVVR